MVLIEFVTDVLLKTGGLLLQVTLASYLKSAAAHALDVLRFYRLCPAMLPISSISAAQIDILTVLLGHEILFYTLDVSLICFYYLI